MKATLIGIPIWWFPSLLLYVNKFCSCIEFFCFWITVEHFLFYMCLTWRISWAWLLHASVMVKSHFHFDWVVKVPRYCGSSVTQIEIPWRHVLVVCGISVTTFSVTSIVFRGVIVTPTGHSLFRSATLNCWFVAQIFGSVIAPYLIDRYGRKSK